MHFQSSDEQQQLADSLGRLLAHHYGFEQRRAIAASAAGWSEAAWRRIAGLGVTAIGIPESFGGLDGGAVDRLPAMQAFGRALLLEPFLASSVLAACAVREGATDAMKDALLPALASGELRLGWAHDEAEAGHGQEPRHIATRARRVGGRWHLHGLKSLVLHAGAAQRFVVSARIDGGVDADADADAESTVALFLVTPGSAGLALREFRLVDDTPAGELALDGAVGEALGDVADGGRARAAIDAALSAGSAAVCADMVGTMETAFALTTAYVNTRKQFGRPIGEYQALRHRIAEMAVSLEMARSMAIAAAAAADAPGAAASAIDLARAKLAIGRHARTLCQAAIQSHGGIGMTEDYAVGHCLRRIHVLDHLFGDVEAQAARLARLHHQDQGDML
ncbi:acyl-CoA dehydrogenase family protein [Variovorax saccharolyticus]|uniref:acyl-CoA dehydrogenase family protein n=1 Tax=Variovorax saccharolyticus TaxID=3053516 RepID=UPI00257887B1|nr:acyl-CoA dehydrogenase [Variovorax sp. J22R187]MDM0021160.1 acyl-CoA dehydrogenase [Variovorax sp. J22R187]